MTYEELARRQRVQPLKSIDQLLPREPLLATRNTRCSRSDSESPEKQTSPDQLGPDQAGGERKRDKACSRRRAPGMPALHRAAKVQNRVSNSGICVVVRGLDQIARNLSSLEDGGGRGSEEVVGQALFAIVDYTRRIGIDPEIALCRAIDRFESGFKGTSDGRKA